jgi:hypothetical protein
MAILVLTVCMTHGRDPSTLRSAAEMARQVAGLRLAPSVQVCVATDTDCTESRPVPILSGDEDTLTDLRHYRELVRL